jgi:hypothetical protein
MTGSFKNAVMNALSKTAFEEAERFAKEIQDNEPFVIIPKGTPLLVYLTRVLEL